MNIVRHSMIMISGTAATAFFALLQGIVIARVLGPEGSGQYQLLVTLGSTLAPFFFLGIGRANIYFLNHYKIEPKQIVTNSITAGSILGLIASFTMFFTLTFGKNYTGNFSFWINLIFPIAVGLMVIQPMFLTILVAQMRVSEYAEATVGPRFCVLLFSGFFAIAGWLSPATALLLMVFLQFLGTAVLVFFLRDHISTKYLPDLKLLWKTIKYGLQLYITSLLFVLDQNIGLISIGFLMPSRFEAIGYFSRGLAICGILKLIPSSLTNLLYSHWATHNDESRIRQVQRMIRVYLMLGILLIVILVSVGRFLIILLYGEVFLPALLPLQILSVRQVLWSISNIFLSLFAGSGKPMIINHDLVISLMFSFIGLLVLIPKMSIMGAAIAVTIGQAILVILNIYHAKRLFNLNLRKCVPLNYNDIVFVWREFSSKLVWRN